MKRWLIWGALGVLVLILTLVGAARGAGWKFSFADRKVGDRAILGVGGRHDCFPEAGRIEIIGPVIFLEIWIEGRRLV